MIYTLTFNPAIDYTAGVNSINVGSTNRSLGEEINFGGKGINVSCVLNELGIESTALGFIAGFTGDALERHLQNLGIKTDFIRLKEGFTRINVKLKGESITEINGKGPKIGENDLKELHKRLDNIACGDTLVLSGSIPESLSKTVYGDIMKRLRDKNIRFVVDAEGDLLINTLKYRPFLIKPNIDELSAVFEKELKGDEEIIACAGKLQKMGALNVLVTMGENGSLLLDEKGKVTRKTAHKIQAVNTVGAGDSMVAGFIAGIEKGYEYALMLGSAAAAATAENMGLATNDKIMKFIK